MKRPLVLGTVIALLGGMIAATALFHDRKRAGNQQAKTPSSAPLEITVGPVGLGPEPIVLRYCRIAAAKLPFPVPCPMMLPGRPIDLPRVDFCFGTDGRLGGNGCF